MQNIVNVADRFPAGFRIADVAFDETEVRILFKRTQILPFSGGKVVENCDFIVLCEQFFREVGADESGSAGDENPRIFDVAFHLKSPRYVLFREDALDVKNHRVFLAERGYVEIGELAVGDGENHGVVIGGEFADVFL